MQSREHYYWYTSRQLIDNAKEELTNIHEQMGSLLGSLKEARRKAALELSMQLKEKDKQKKALEQENIDLLAQMAVKDADIARLQALVRPPTASSVQPPSADTLPSAAASLQPLSPGTLPGAPSSVQPPPLET